MEPEKRKPEEPEAARSPAVSTEVTQPSAPPPTQATSSEGASGSAERADKSDIHGAKAGAENANEKHDESSDGEEAKMKTQHCSLVTRENQVKAGIEENRHPVKEALKDSPNHDSQSPEVTSKAVSSGDDVNDSLKSLRERLSATLVNVSCKEDFVKQHSKVAEEAVAGWEKAKNEVASLKLQLEAAVKRNSVLEDRVSHLDGAVKEYVAQLRQLNGDIANAKDGLSQKENEFLEAGQIINELQNEKKELYIRVEDLTSKSDNAKDVEEVEGDEVDEEDEEDEEVEGDEVDEEDVERPTFWVCFTSPYFPTEVLIGSGNMNLDNYNEINEVDQEVWRIIFTEHWEELFGCGSREELFFWYVRFTEDGSWDYLSRPWDRFCREANGVVVTHQDPEPQLLPALGDI